MGTLKAGFARLDITPPLGTNLVGYPRRRPADGILDPLLATAVAVSDGENTAVMMSIDLIGIDQVTMDRIRHGVSEKQGIPYEMVFVACTHTHLGHGIAKVYDTSPDYQTHVDILVNKAIGVAMLAIEDLKDAEMYVNSCDSPVNIAYIRRYRMKDGSTATNPGWRNPEIDHPLGTPDKRVALTYFKRENAPEIALINFQVHPDTISGCKISADFPHFVRKTYEAAVPNSLCMYINGAQGDTNLGNVNAEEYMPRRGYVIAEHVGRTIAGTALSLHAMAEKVEGCPIAAKQINIEVPHNKATTPEEVEEAKRIVEQVDKDGLKSLPIPPGHGEMTRVTTYYGAKRIVNLENAPDYKTLYVTGLRVGEFTLVGFPGEPFTDIGRKVKEASDYKMTFIACCANGYEGYYPTTSAMDEGGYEANTAKYKKGTADKLIETGIQTLKEMR